MDYESIRSKVCDYRGARLTVSLFEELCDDRSAIKPPFKLSEWRKRYVEIADPTGYEAAMDLLGDWEHWQLIVKSPTFAPHLEAWNREVEVKLRSQALRQIMKQSKLPTGTAAAKWLAEAGFASRDKRRKGAKQEEEQLSKEARANVADDAKRLGLVAVK